MSEIIELDAEGRQIGKPPRKPDESDPLRQWLVRIGVAVVALVVVIWLISLIAGRIGLAHATRHIYNRLQAGASAKGGTDAQIRAFGAALSRGQVRVLVSGRSVSYEDLSPKQQDLFNAIAPLSDPKAPDTAPYQVGLDEFGGKPQLRMVWMVRGGDEAVVRRVGL